MTLNPSEISLMTTRQVYKQKAGNKGGKITAVAYRGRGGVKGVLPTPDPTLISKISFTYGGWGVNLFKGGGNF